MTTDKVILCPVCGAPAERRMFSPWIIECPNRHSSFMPDKPPAKTSSPPFKESVVPISTVLRGMKRAPKQKPKPLVYKSVDDVLKDLD